MRTKFEIIAKVAGTANLRRLRRQLVDVTRQHLPDVQEVDLVRIAEYPPGAEALARAQSVGDMAKCCDIFVEADGFASNALWKCHASDSDWRPEKSVAVQWRAYNGKFDTIGEIAGMPVTLTLMPAVLGTGEAQLVVGFYESTSQVTDYRMVEDFLQRHYKSPDVEKTDAMNFHRVLDKLEKLFLAAGAVEGELGDPVEKPGDIKLPRPVPPPVPVQLPTLEDLLLRLGMAPSAATLADAQTYYGGEWQRDGVDADQLADDVVLCLEFVADLLDKVKTPTT